MPKFGKTELSKRSEWWIPRARYYELKWFCMQYTSWVRLRKDLIKIESNANLMEERVDTSNLPDPTASTAMKIKFYDDRIKMIDRCMYEAADGNEYAINMLAEGICTGASYDKMGYRMEVGIPMISRDEYYDKYRKFFYLLDKERDPMP